MYSFILNDILDKRKQEIFDTMLKACDAKHAILMRYGKVLFCGASAAGKSNFLNLLMEEKFQSMHKSTQVLKPHQVSVAMKAIMSSNKDEVEFKTMSIEEEILELESYLPKTYTESTSDQGKKEKILKGNSEEKIPDTEPITKSPKTDLDIKTTDSTAENFDLALADVYSEKKPKKDFGRVWDILTFMDTGGQPQFISMLPAVNSFAMITFIVHKLKEGGKKSLRKTVEVQYGNEKGEVTSDLYPPKYTYLQLIETLISYASNILLPDTKFLDNLKSKSEGNDIGKQVKKHNRSILLVGTHSGDDKLSVEDIGEIGEELKIAVERSGVDHIKPYVNEKYKYLVPVDNEKQNRKSDKQVPEEIEPKRYTRVSEIRKYIKELLENQAEFHIPIKWLLLELEIRKVCQQKKCSLIAYTKVLELAEEKKFGYAGEFGDDELSSDEFIKQGLRFHHSFGVLLYFEEVKEMQELIITNHQWLFNKLTEIVCYSFKRNCNTVGSINDFEKKGILDKALLGSNFLNIGKDFEDSGIDIEMINPVESFLSLLRHLRIAAPLSENDDRIFMPFVLESCELNDLTKIFPELKETSKIPPLLFQFKSIDSKTSSFPRGTFCFLVIDLMLCKKWIICGQAYVNAIKFNIRKTVIILVDRIFCLEIHAKCEEHICNEICVNISEALQRVAKKLKVHGNLCYGFSCPCSKTADDMHISYVSEDNNECCTCCLDGSSSVDLMDCHRVWLTSYFNKVKTS